ncbi:MAG: lysophospholipase [Methylococcaceae bacterium]|nr:lysophospholipase [Methylococcaceae bacterium]
MHHRFPNPLLRSLIILALLLCVGCTPLVNRPGEQVTTPHLEFAHFVTADGAVLPVRSWIPKQEPVKAVIVALHGFNDYSKFFTRPGQYLSQRGIACYAYDQRGFGNAPGRGLWPGVKAYRDDLRAFTAEVRLHHPGVPLYVLGESMGAAVAIVSMGFEDPPEADGLILSSPAVWSRSTMPWHQRLLLETGAHVAPWLRLTGEGLRIMASDNIDMLRELARDPLVIKATRVDAIYGLANLMDEAQVQVKKLKIATLVLYGEHDEVVPREPIELMLEKMQGLPQTRTAFYENGYHLLLRDLQAQKPWNDIAAWIENRNAPLPSGADRRMSLGLAEVR